MILSKNKNDITTRFSRTILLILFGATSFLIISTMIFELYREYESSKSQLKTTSQYLARAIHTKLMFINASMSRFASSSISVNAMIETRFSTTYFEHMIESLKSIDGVQDVLIFTYDGEIKRYKKNMNTDWYKREYVLQTLADSEWHYFIDKSNKEIYAVYPIQYFNTPQGGIVARINLQSIVTPILTQKQEGTYHSISILGQVIFNSKDIHDETISEIGFVDSSAFPIAVQLNTPVSMIFSKKKFRFFIMILLGVVCMILILPLSKNIGHKLAKPITRLIDKIRNNDYPVSPIGTNDELEILAQSFDQARKDLEGVLLEKAASERRDRESEVRAIVNTVLDGIVTINTSGTVITFNPAAENIFGYTKDQVIGNNIKLLMPEPYKNEHDGYMLDYLNGGNAKVIGKVREMSGRKSDGTTFPIELSVSEMWVANERFFTGTIRDISERKESERMKNEFVSTVSHELRTPLTSISGSLAILGKQLEGNIPDKLQNMISIAQRNASRLTLLINDLLDLEKLSSGKMEMSFELHNLNDILKRSVEDNQEYAKSKKINVKVSYPSSSLPVICDENRVLQVMANLISNAVKFSKDGDYIETWLDEKDQFYWIYVRDHGSGIPDEFKSRIFNRFAQANSSDTRSVGGTGLGLSISKCIVELHNGDIGYDSTEGEGSTFFFSLPKAADQGSLDNESQSLS